MPWELRLLAVAVLVFVVRRTLGWYATTHSVIHQAEALEQEDVSRMHEAELSERQDRITRISCVASFLLLLLSGVAPLVHAGVWLALIRLQPQGAWVPDLATRYVPLGMLTAAVWFAFVIRVKISDDASSSPRMTRWIRRCAIVGTCVAVSVAPRGFLLYFAVHTALSNLFSSSNVRRTA
jgi:hypothetical protein